ncbi:MAG: family 43 glycosylhydrolase, partial [Prevotella sp.]|nr:family 43 glycosylhydrolase [Prevotella sp.]
MQTPGNPYLPLWEHIPDGEPYVFEDPDHPGKYRVYIYGSHDDLITEYCGRDQVVWSADVDDLSNWRYDGVILVVDKNAKGEPFDSAGTADVLYAPDVTLVTAPDGTKTYYLFPNDQTGGRNGLIAKSSRPDGPFEVCNWNADNANMVDGVLKFDPAVFVDDDGRVYGYWGFERSYAAELDPATMATVKPGTPVVEDMVSGRYLKGDFSFFEASSIRKIKDKYVFIYSRFTKEGEFGLPVSNYTLAYAYSDHPLGPWTYGGTIIDGRARDINEQGDTIPTATPDGNTHGSICEINGQWYVFYHRQTGLNEFARQAMVAPISVDVVEGPGGKVTISEGEYNSEGFALDGLDPFETHSAGIACWHTGPKPAVHEWPNN